MKKVLSLLCVVSGLAVLAGCSSYSGKTYGTGTSHEEDTMKSIVNLLAIRSEEQEKIDYSARPELIMPANQQALPSPADEAVAGVDENWPVTPEERIIALRESAPEADERSGEIPLDYQLSEKAGIKSGREAYLEDLAREPRNNEGHLETLLLDKKGKETTKQVRERRKDLAYSTGATRKYLTEPPSEYRTPSETAEAGETGLTKEEIKEVQKQVKAARVERR